jgi:hypothetical protein
VVSHQRYNGVKQTTPLNKGMLGTKIPAKKIKFNYTSNPYNNNHLRKNTREKIVTFLLVN